MNHISLLNFIFLVKKNNFEPSLSQRNIHKIPRRFSFPIIEKVNNTYISNGKFYDPEKKEKQEEFYEKGLFKSNESKIGVETKFYLYASPERATLKLKYEDANYVFYLKRDLTTTKEPKFRGNGI